MWRRPAPSTSATRRASPSCRPSWRRRSSARGRTRSRPPRRRWARRRRSSRRPSGASTSCPRRRRRPASWSIRSTGRASGWRPARPWSRCCRPSNVKVRFFVPEPQLGAIEVGDEVQVSCDACAPDLVAEISFIAPEAEYTPPVIYSREMRAKLVYLVEAKPRQPDGAAPGPAGRRDPCACPPAEACAMQPDAPAISVQGLAKVLGGRHGDRGFLDRRARRPHLRLSRAERQRQDHDHPHAVRPADARCRQRPLPRLRHHRARALRSSARSATCRSASASTRTSASART